MRYLTHYGQFSARIRQLYKGDFRKRLIVIANLAGLSQGSCMSRLWPITGTRYREWRGAGCQPTRFIIRWQRLQTGSDTRSGSHSWARCISGSSCWTYPAVHLKDLCQLSPEPSQSRLTINKIPISCTSVQKMTCTVDMKVAGSSPRQNHELNHCNKVSSCIKWKKSPYITVSAKKNHL